MLTLYRVRHSNNVERVALALAHKGLEAESVWVPFEDRSEVRRVEPGTDHPRQVDWIARMDRRPRRIG